MPSRSTNLLAKKPHAPPQKLDKRKRDAAPPPAAARPAAPAVVEEQEVVKEEPAKKKVKKADGAAAAAKGEEEESGDDEEDSSDEEDEETETTKTESKGEVKQAVGEQLPSKETVESDKSLNDGCRLALLYALLYLRFNPVPLVSTSSAPSQKSMKSPHPLNPDPYSSSSSSPSLFASDWTPPNAQFELTQAQYAAKKKQARDGKAKKGDGRTGERWTFNKARESWLIRWCCEEAHLPTAYFPIALAYLTSVKAQGARDLLSAQARDALTGDAEKVRRAKLVLKRCFGEGEEEEEEGSANGENGEEASTEEAEEEDGSDEE